MSIPALNWAYAQRVDDMAAKFLLVTLANCHNLERNQCNPKISDLVAYMGCSRRTVEDKIKALRKAKLIIVKRGQYGFAFELQMRSSCVSADSPDTQNTSSRYANERSSDTQNSVPYNRNTNNRNQPERVAHSARDSARAKSSTSILAIRKALETVLSPDMATAIIEHRQAIKRPLAKRAAELLAKHYAQAWVVCGLTPDQAADFHIERGWTGFEPEWVLNAKQAKRATGPPSGQPQTMSEILLKEQGNVGQTIDHHDTELPATRRAKSGGT